MRILIGADIVPTDSNIDYFTNCETKKILGNKLYEKIKSYDYRIFNLEVPLTDDFNPISKQGPNLIAPPETIKGLNELQVNLFTLANNHIMDQDEKGLNDTIELLDKWNIGHVGAGSDLNSACKPFIFMKNDMKIGIYACAEHEFSIVNENSSGANPFDPLNSFDHVKQLSKEVDYTIVLYHGGKEHYRYPSPNLQKICRKFADVGANLVICQHSHCIGCEEIYNNCNIIYGQGNFIFDDCDSEYWKTSILIGLELINSNGQLSKKLDYIPIIKNNEKIRIGTIEEKKEILKNFRTRSNQIKKSKFVEENYKKYSEEKFLYYMNALLGKMNLIEKIINKLSKGRYLSYKFGKKYDKRNILKLINYLECEAHNELFKSGLHRYLKNYK